MCHMRCLSVTGAAGAGCLCRCAKGPLPCLFPTTTCDVTRLILTHMSLLSFISTLPQVQKHSIPVLLSGRDALVRSPTGSGKTLAYLAPMVHALAAAQPRITRADGTYGVVLVPTRELAVQVRLGWGWG